MDSMSDAILALNAGSSSLKFALFTLERNGDPKLSCRGEIENAGSAPQLTITDAAGTSLSLTI